MTENFPCRSYGKLVMFCLDFSSFVGGKLLLTLVIERSISSVLLNHVLGTPLWVFLFGDAVFNVQSFHILAVHSSKLAVHHSKAYWMCSFEL